MTMQRSFGARLSVLAGAMFAVCLPALAQHASQPAPVTVAIAKTVRMAPTIALPGTVVAQDDSHIASQVEGSVVWVAKVGDVVNHRKDFVVAQLLAGDLEHFIFDHVAQVQWLEDQLQRAFQ